MKTILKCSVIILLAALGILLFIVLTRHVDRLGHFDAVMVDNDLYLIPAEDCKVGAITVFVSSATPPNSVVMWSVWGGGRSKTEQIKYGQVNGFDSEEGPQELQRNVKYLAIMGTSLKASLGTRGDFTIVDSNKIIMTRYFDSKRPKKHTVLVERNGEKIIVPYSVSFDENGSKVIVSGTITGK